MKYLLILCAMLSVQFTYATNLAPLNKHNQAAFNTVEKNLRRATLIQGDFSQTRHIKLLSAPLYSSGQFTLSQHDGLLWQQSKPFKSTLRLSQDRLEQTMGDNPPMVMTKQQQPVVFSFTQIFLSMFNGNTQALSKNFNLLFAGTPESWHLRLSPTSTMLQKAIAHIDIRGDQYIRHIMISEANDNHMLISFQHLKVQTSS